MGRNTVPVTTGESEKHILYIKGPVYFIDDDGVYHKLELKEFPASSGQWMLTESASTSTPP